MNRPITVTVANWAGVNTGDDAIFSSLLNLIYTSISPDVKIYVLADNEMEIQRKYPVQGTACIYDFYKLENITKVLRFLKESDIVIYGGGDLINGDIPSMTFLRLAKLLGVPVMCCSVGVVPISSPVQRFFTRAGLNSADLITVRDNESKYRLEQLGIVNTPIHVTADLAFLLLPKLHMNRLLDHHMNGNSTPSLRIGVNIRSQDDMYSFYAHWNEEVFIRSMVSVCNDLIEENDAHILFLPMETCKRRKEYHDHTFDETIGLRLKDNIGRKDRFSIIDGDYTPDEFKGLLSKIDLLVSMRLHTLLLASDIGIPMVAFDYAPKMRSFMSMIDMEDRLVSMDEVNKDAFLSTIRKALKDGPNNNSEKIKELTKRSQENIVLLHEMLAVKKKKRWRFYAFLPATPFYSAANYLAVTLQSVKGGGRQR